MSTPPHGEEQPIIDAAEQDLYDDEPPEFDPEEFDRMWEE